ncbi:MAG TPA: alternative ribosome rescue aminoacyl-tRNA hydrolase ArfB [Acidimicrobiales bacterium]|nr:alternative ribosome rescue aminoacyl-tRNA hydrolase ArfB [Acidimicrobiales bacterium]
MSDGEEGRVFLAPGVWLPLAEITWRFSTAGGPGGQHVNTSNTRAEASFDVEHSPTLAPWARDRLLARLGPVVTVAAGDTRSQARNRELALLRLADRLSHALEVRRSRRATRPTAASKRRRLEDKRRRSQVKSERRRSRGRPEAD